MCNPLVPGEGEGKGGRIQENQRKLRPLKRQPGEDSRVIPLYHPLYPMYC